MSTTGKTNFNKMTRAERIWTDLDLPMAKRISNVENTSFTKTIRHYEDAGQDPWSEYWDAKAGDFNATFYAKQNEFFQAECKRLASKAGWRRQRATK
jgi:hypothetical protein